MKNLSFPTNFSQYVNEHQTKKITVGKSGADVYELDNNYIAKHVRRNLISSDENWNAYKREAEFYSACSQEQFPFLPKIYHCCQTDDEIQLIMKKYLPLNRKNIGAPLLENVFGVLAQIHNMPLPGFLFSAGMTSTIIDKEDINLCFSGWLDVISEHADTFPQSDLIKISENINTINQQLSSHKKMCCHGDFHFENILTDHNGNIIVCDWQNVSIGHASSDISFFLSRLSADGIEISKEKAIQTYCSFDSQIITPDEIAIQMSFANLFTSFIHWHNYLHGCSAERVAVIWDKMIADAEFLYRFLAK